MTRWCVPNNIFVMRYKLNNILGSIAILSVCFLPSPFLLGLMLFLSGKGSDILGTLSCMTMFVILIRVLALTAWEDNLHHHHHQLQLSKWSKAHNLSWNVKILSFFFPSCLVFFFFFFLRKYWFLQLLMAAPEKKHRMPSAYNRFMK